MNRLIVFLALTTLCSFSSYSQKTIDDPFDQESMRKDLALFREIREAANSGVNKYRSEKEIDNIYSWANTEISNSSTLIDFYNILWEITDFEGSLHNSLFLPPKANKNYRQESEGYFPYPIKIIGGKVHINFENEEIPLGSQIVNINNLSIKEIIPSLYKYYTTDGFNITGKEIGINAGFSSYYRLEYGKQDLFEVQYLKQNSDDTIKIELKSVARADYFKNFVKRHSLTYDGLSYEVDEDPPYRFSVIEGNIGHLSIHSFSIGSNENHPKHIEYVHFLDSIFELVQTKKIDDLIIDVRHNGGGSDPNDLVTYSYLTDRNFSENIDAWTTFTKPPYWRYNKERSIFLKPLERMIYHKILKKDFPVGKEERYYQDATSSDRKIRTPNKLSFKGNIYLLVSPRTASAGSLFAAMAAGNENTTTIGRETQGGYYGHNGHIPVRYRLPKSKIKFMFSIVNLKQDVPQKDSQLFGRGILPDFVVEQSFQDFLANKDTELEYTIDLIKKQGE